MTTEDKKTQDLLRKIKALRAKADDASTTEAESLAFASKVAELLAQHGLEEAQLDVNEQEEQIGHEDYISNWNSSPARRKLAIAVCTLYFVKPLIRTKKGAPWSLIGRKHNIAMAKDMTAYLIKTTIRLSNAYGREHPLGNVIDFRRGCFQRLSERIMEMYWEQARKDAPKYNAKGNPENLPALYKSENDLLTAYLRQAFPHTGVYRGKAIKQGSSAWAGRQAGDNISLNQQVGGGRSNHLLGRPKKS
jgi:Protein of unknown function (DUF2786)